jgi:hypothetical protein
MVNEACPGGKQKGRFRPLDRFSLEKRVNEGSDRASLRQNNQSAEQKEHDHDRREPPFLALEQILHELSDDADLPHCIALSR